MKKSQNLNDNEIDEMFIYTTKSNIFLNQFQF